MPSYEKEKCPVCEKGFVAEDDVVICPQCGTPHHRDCYNSLGHCANADKHSSGFEFEPYEVLEERRAKEECESQGRYYFKQSKEKKKCVRCNEDIDERAVYCDKCGARQPVGNSQQQANQSINFGLDLNIRTGYENSTEKIDGNSAADAASVVRTNTARFMPKFFANKKLSWNWSAFIFGPFYLFFRKMYKEGIIAFAVRLIVSLVAQGVYAQQYSDFYRFVSSNYDKLVSNPSESMINQMTELYTALVPMMAIVVTANALIHIVIAAFADRFYRSKVLSVLDSVDKKLADGGMFDQSFTMPDNEINLSQDDMKKLYLSKLGGTSIFAPVMAFFIYDMITTIISNL